MEPYDILPEDPKDYRKRAWALALSSRKLPDAPLPSKLANAPSAWPNSKLNFAKGVAASTVGASSNQERATLSADAPPIGTDPMGSSEAVATLSSHSPTTTSMIDPPTDPKGSKGSSSGKDLSKSKREKERKKKKKRSHGSRDAPTSAPDLLHSEASPPAPEAGPSKKQKRVTPSLVAPSSVDIEGAKEYPAPTTVVPSTLGLSSQSKGQDPLSFAAATREEQDRVTEQVFEQVPSYDLSRLSKRNVKQTHGLRVSLTNVFLDFEALELVVEKQGKDLRDARAEIARLSGCGVQLDAASAKIIELQASCEQLTVANAEIDKLNALLEQAHGEVEKGKSALQQLEASRLETDSVREQFSQLQEKHDHEVQQLHESKERLEERVRDLESEK